MLSIGFIECFLIDTQKGYRVPHPNFKPPTSWRRFHMMLRFKNYWQNDMSIAP